MRIGVLHQSLSKPHATYRTPGMRFELYRAKDLGERRWNGRALKALVATCRMAYSRYGKRPLFDEYDGKAAVYLVRARYQQKGVKGEIHEWLSIRMVPGDGAPLGVGEPEIYQSKGGRVDRLMMSELGAHNFWNHIASSSRMCGIPPYAVMANGVVKPLKNFSRRSNAIAFALIHKQFVLDYPLNKFPYHHITAMIREDVRDRVLQGASLFVPAYRFLGLRRTDMSVRRDVYSYAFPLYWFDNQKLLDLVNKLRQNNGKKMAAELTPQMFSSLSSRSSRPAIIAGLRVVPRHMRSLIDGFVPDAPELKITNARRWYRGMESILRAAKVERID